MPIDESMDLKKKIRKQKELNLNEKGMSKVENRYLISIFILSYTKLGWCLLTKSIRKYYESNI